MGIPTAQKPRNHSLRFDRERQHPRSDPASRSGAPARSRAPETRQGRPAGRAPRTASARQRSAHRPGRRCRSSGLGHEIAARTRSPTSPPASPRRPPAAAPSISQTATGKVTNSTGQALNGAIASADIAPATSAMAARFQPQARMIESPATRNLLVEITASRLHRRGRRCIVIGRRHGWYRARPRGGFARVVARADAFPIPIRSRLTRRGSASSTSISKLPGPA